MHTGNCTGSRHSGRVAGLLFFSGLIIIASGCASMATRYPYSTADEYGTDIEAYAEHVFRLQNRVSSRLILALAEPGEDEDTGALAQAEERILEACESLNQIAIMRAEKGWITPQMRYKAYDTLERCEHTTREVELMLEPDTAAE